MEECFQVPDTVGSNVTLLSLKETPVSIFRNAIESGALELLQRIEPKAWHRLAERVKLARVEHHAFAMNEERVSIIGDRTV